MEPERLTCRVCEVTKPTEAFTRWTTSEGNGRRYRLRTCAECTRAKNNERNLRWRNKNREYVKQKARDNMKRWRDNMSDEQKREYNAKVAEKARNRRARLKAAVYLAYGGAVCACCGENEPTFLSLDHVNNDGYNHRKTLQTGEQIWRWIIDNGFPDGFQILCMNCNHSKSRNGGVCAHITGKVQRLSGNGVGSSEPKRPALFCEEVKI